MMQMRPPGIFAAPFLAWYTRGVFELFRILTLLPPAVDTPPPCMAKSGVSVQLMNCNCVFYMPNKEDAG